MRIKPIGEWNAMFVGLALIPLIGFLFIVFTGECLNPYETCTASAFDYLFPLLITFVLLAAAGINKK